MLHAALCAWVIAAQDAPKASVHLSAGWLSAVLTSRQGSEVTKTQTPWMVQKKRNFAGRSLTPSNLRSLPSTRIRATRWLPRRSAQSPTSAVRSKARGAAAPLASVDSASVTKLSDPTAS